jgi:hypothetical protein
VLENLKIFFLKETRKNSRLCAYDTTHTLSNTLSNQKIKTIGDHNKFKALFQIIAENNELIRSVIGLQLIIRLDIVEFKN